TKGIEGIKSVTKGNDIFNTSKRSNIYLAKLLKDTYKSEILRYLDFFNLEYMIDSTNLENEYFRNIIRNDIFPYIQKNTNFDIKKGLNTLSQNIFKQNTYINNIVRNKFNEIRITNSDANNNSDTDNNKCIYLDLDLDKLKKEDEYIIKEICIYAFNNLKIIKDISKQNIEDIYNLICNGISGKKICPTKFCEVGIKKINNPKVLYIIKI
ncbi:MAG: ATP-binding protein, partial [Clostridium sp.]